MNKSSKSKKRFKIIVSLLLVTAILITGALAYLTATDTAKNVFTVGNVKISLDEPHWVESNGLNITPGKVIAKDPTVTNTGNNDAYVYVMVTVPKKDAIKVNEDGITVTKDDYQLFNYTLNDGWTEIASKIDADDANNYYLYAYNNALAPSNKTVPPVFNNVVFGNITEDQIASDEELNILIDAYAIQSDYYNGEAIDAASAWKLYATQNGWNFPSDPADSTVTGDSNNVNPVQVFSLNNLADNGHLEGVFRKSNQYGAGSTGLSNDCYSGTTSLKCFSTSHRKGVSRITLFEDLPLGEYYIACKTKVERYVAGDAGVVIDGGGNNFTPIAVTKETTNGEFITASGITTISDSTDVSFIFGSTNLKNASDADLDCFIDDIVFIPLSVFEEKPTKEQLDVWYEEYLDYLDSFYAEETVLVVEARDTFIDKMNEKAQELGMTNTSITTADGMGYNLTTTRDAMMLMVAASKNEVLTEIWQNTYSNEGANGTQTITVANGEKIRTVTAKSTINDETLLTNYNLLGGKTGTSSTRCIGVIAEIDGQKVVAVIMGATSEANRYSAINDLLGIATNKLTDPNYNASAETVEDAPSAIAAVITDDGCDILYEQEADTPQQLASMVKVLNILTTLDYVDIENYKTETVQLRYSENGDNLYMYDELTYEEAFYYMMLPSNNTAAKVVARSVGEKIINS